MRLRLIGLPRKQKQQRNLRPKKRDEKRKKRTERRKRTRKSVPRREKRKPVMMNQAMRTPDPNGEDA